MITLIFITTIAGFAAHQLRRVTNQFATGWRELMNYGIGAVGLLPFGMLFHNHLEERRRSESFAIAYILTVVSFGIGVIAGWIFDEIEIQKE